MAVGVAFFGIAVLLGLPPRDGFLFGVAVALVPQGLLPTATLSLALGARRMSERHALVRSLESVESVESVESAESVETFGSTTSLVPKCCLDAGARTPSRVGV